MLGWLPHRVGGSRNNVCPGHPDIPLPAQAAWNNHGEVPPTCQHPSILGVQPPRQSHGQWGGAPAAPILHGDKLCPMPASRDGTLDEGTTPACAGLWATA